MTKIKFLSCEIHEFIICDLCEKLVIKKKVVTNPNNKKSLSLQFKIEVMMPPSKTKKKKFLQPEQNKMEEPLAEYFKSDQYTESVKTLPFQVMRKVKSVPEQRLELLIYC